MKIIIYGSQYGTAKQYATELAKRVKCEIKSYEEIKDINSYETIIYIGALYAGGVLGMKKTLRNLQSITDKKIIIVTVGLADPYDKENTETIRSGIKKQLSAEVYDNAVFFHLRGGIDYSRLNFKHKTMMSLLYRKAINLPKEKKTSEVQAMIETYNKQVNYIDFNELDSIIHNI